MGSPFLFSIYSGLLVSALLVGAVFIRPRGGSFVLLLILFSLLVALGGNLPFMRWLYDAGIVTSIRYPEKFVLIAIFATIVFASQLLDRLLAGDDAVADGALGFLIATTVIAMLIAIAGFTPLYGKAMTKLWSLSGGNAKRVISISHTDWMIAFARGVAYIALLLTVRKPRRDIWLAALTVVVCADLGMVMYELNPRMPRRFFDRPPASRRFPAARTDFRVFHEADWYGQEETARKYFSTGDAVYWIVRNGLFPMTPAGSKVPTVLERDYDKTSLLSTVDLTDSIWDVKRSGKTDWYTPFMAMSNAWYRGVYRDFERERKRVGGKMKEAEPIDFREGPHYPRYYFADQLITIRSRLQFVDNLSHNSYTPAVAFIGQPSFMPARGEVRGVRETANSATIDVESFGQGFLVMSVTPHKYWRITVDGKETPAIVTNIGYQGIIVTPGTHTVVMRYRNELVRAGMLISIVSIILLAGIAVLKPRRVGVEDVAYEEPVHVVADPDGTHVEAVVEPVSEPVDGDRS
jgi:hypothetical protein